MIRADLFAPIDSETFLRSVYGRRFQRFDRVDSGAAGNLLTWRDASGIVSRHWQEPGRVRLARLGVPVPPETYIDTFLNTQRLSLPKLLEQLRTGATILIDDVSILHEPVGRLTNILENLVRERVDSQLFMSGGDISGFRPHFDPYDVFVFQLSGVKSWTVFEPTRPAPLIRDVEEAVFDNAVMVDKFEMHPGDFIYIPRGWWHEVRPVGVPTLHLTMPIRKRVGIDFMTWIVDRLRAETTMRTDIPRFGTESDQEQYVHRLGAIMRDQLTLGRLHEYLTAHDGHAIAERWVGLPWAFNQDAGELSEETAVRVLVPRAVLDTDGADGVTLRADGQEFTFSAAAADLLTALLDGETTTVRALLVRTALTHTQVSATLIDLAKHGLVEIGS